MNKSIVLGIVILIIGFSFTGTTYSLSMNRSKTLGFDGNILYVGGNGSGNYTRIQDAIDNASDGDTVFVYDDSSPYYGLIIINKSINLIGENRDTTIIDGQNMGNVILIKANGVSLTGFTVQHSINRPGTNYAGVKVHTSNNKIYENNIRKHYTFGIAIWYGKNNEIFSNYIINSGVSLSVFQTSNNLFYDNTLSGYCGVALSESSGNVISHNVIFGEKRGIHNYVSDWTTIEHNVIYDCRTGVYVNIQSYDVKFKLNTFKNNYCAILCGYCNRIELIYNNFQSNTYNVDLYSAHNFFVNGNYWNRPRFRPYPIYGHIDGEYKVVYDYNPALLPWDINETTNYDIDDYLRIIDNPLLGRFPLLQRLLYIWKENIE